MMVGKIRLVSLCGMLGYGYPVESLRAALRERPAFLGVDAGSTDPGPHYLGSGEGFVKATQVERDLDLALCAAREKDIPLIIGSAGGSGARPHLDAFLDVLRAIATRRNLHFRLAVIPADVKSETVLDALRDERIAPCGPSGELTEDKVIGCSQIVAQMGVAPIIRALDGGADVVVAGRCCDTAIFAALPIMRGFDPGLALHLAKIAECGALCASPAGANDTLTGLLRRDHFVVEPANPARRCTPETVAAHSLYEQPDPDCFYEPEGKVDLSECSFRQEGPRSVRVSGSRLVPAEEQRLKIEGASLRGYRTITVAGIRDPLAIGRIDELERGVRAAVAGALSGDVGADDYSLRFLRYGLDAVTGSPAPPAGAQPQEVGLVIEAIAATQEVADTVLSLARSSALHQHFSGRKATAGNLAFPFSPSDFRGGPVYEFSVYHLMETGDAEALFPVTFEKV